MASANQCSSSSRIRVRTAFALVEPRAFRTCLTTPSRHPTEPTCNYDPIEGLQPAPDTVDNPSDKVKVLETQIGALETAAPWTGLSHRLVFD